MWSFLARFITQYKIYILALLLLATAFMAYQAQFVKMQYSLAKLLPSNDTTQVCYDNFKLRFNTDSTEIIVLGIDQNPLKSLSLYNEWYELGESLKAVAGIEQVLSVTHCPNLFKDTIRRRLTIGMVHQSTVNNGQKLDSIRKVIGQLPFYQGILLADSSEATALTISIDPQMINSNRRKEVLQPILAKVEAFEARNQLDVKISGMRYVRVIFTNMVKQELQSFVFLSLGATILILLLLFRAWKPVAIAFSVVILSVIWSLGLLSMLGFKITILTSLLPPLTIVIGIPNCVYFINKYFLAIKNQQDHDTALYQMIKKIGFITFLTNLTTAIGFFTFVFTNTQILHEFGIVASVNILVLFLITIIIVPSLVDYLKPSPKKLSGGVSEDWINRLVRSFVLLINTTSKRLMVYLTTLAVILISILGINQLKITGNFTDDLRESAQVVRDLRFFESAFGGVMPLDIQIEASKKGDATRRATLMRIDRFQHSLRDSFPKLAKPMSLVDGVKFAKQAYYGGIPAKYELVKRMERPFVMPYIAKLRRYENFGTAYIDSSRKFIRISTQTQDLSTEELDQLFSKLKLLVATSFPAEKYQVSLTGKSVIFLAGTKYLVKNLVISLVIAIVVIAALMAALFQSIRMILISVFINLIPLLITGGMMGYFDIALKPSTILIFSIAFGIAVDDTIHFLAKYKQVMLQNKDADFVTQVYETLMETGVSMIYSSLILFFGFAVFASSAFGGTQALGVLVPTTLLMAMLADLVLLPALLISALPGKSASADRA